MKNRRENQEKSGTQKLREFETMLNECFDNEDSKREWTINACRLGDLTRGEAGYIISRTEADRRR